MFKCFQSEEERLQQDKDATKVRMSDVFASVFKSSLYYLMPPGLNLSDYFFPSVSKIRMFAGVCSLF